MIEEKLEETRRRLLDLTRANRLLNHRAAGQRTLQIVDEVPGQVYEILIGHGYTMQFLPREEAPAESGKLPDEQSETIPADLSPPDVEADFKSEISDSTTRISNSKSEISNPPPSTPLPLPPIEVTDRPAERHIDRNLQTLLSGEKLQTRLIHLAREAASALEEQGYNILYLTLGVVQWQEEGGGPVCRAPLVFIPVELDRKSVHSRYSLHPFDDDILTNPCLAELCLRDFKFTLPVFVSDGEASLESYFNSIRDQIGGLKNWAFFPEIHLGLFSFSKLLMYRDLDPKIWPESRKLSDHPLIRQLTGINSDAILKGDGIPDPYTLDDAVKPEECFQVVDADSSQQAAILAAKRGTSLVIEGPPGTGKSQTITNIIAECLAEGKSVLFVAEKIAALDVVKRRLTNTGLGDFVLELHSRKTSKKALHQELQRVLSKSNAPPRGNPPSPAELQSVRGKLNAVRHELHGTLGKLNLSPFEVMSRATGLAGEPEAACQIPDPLEWTAEHLVKSTEMLQTLDQRLGRVGDPGIHPWRGVGPVSTGIESQQRIRAACVAFIEAIRDVLNHATHLATMLGTALPAAIAASDTLLTRGKILQAAPRMSAASLLDARWNETSPEIQRVFISGDLRTTQKSIWSKWFKADAELIGWNDTHLRRHAHHASWLRFLRPSWYRDSKLMASHLQGAAMPPITDQLASLQALMESRMLRAKIEADAPAIADMFGDQWRGVDSDWPALRQFAAGAVAVRQLILRQVIATPAAQAIIELPPEKREEFSRAITALAQSLDTASERWLAWSTVIAATDQQWLGGEWKRAELPVIINRLAPLPEKLDMLRDWVDFSAAVRDGQASPLASFVNWVLTPAGQPARGRIAKTFERHFYRLWIEAAFAQRPHLRDFHGDEHQVKIDRFKKLDVDWIDATRDRLTSRLAAHRPDAAYAANRQSKLGIVQAEIRKKSRHLPLRRLLAEAGEVIQSIKPCFMMSPLSVAQYLAPGCVEFDVVIFDEASQVEPADAYGAIARGKQLLLVGDERQLPPTNFFSRVDTEEAAAEGSEFQVGDLESILSLGLVRLPQHCGLRWHYRSRHASLIDFSNQKFYDGNLRVFPSPHTDSRELGLSFHFVEGGIYQRGGRHNAIEAATVANAVLLHAIEQPGMSLGVGTLNLPQQQAIQDEIERLRRETKDPRIEKFFEDHEAEPFFVKNLENIQGDERDAIFLSIGRAPDASGKVSMNFGALNGDGGWRRLNVLITRARQKCIVFSSIRSEDINLGATQARGVVALKEYLYAAEHGRLADASVPGTEHDSEFEAAVCRALREHGWEIHPQVGCAGFAIDLAAVNPAHPGRYLLGIECDGATYHSAPTARDRDRLRQEVLERLGWTIHRIWSTDWFHRPQAVLEPLLKRLEELKEKARSNFVGSASADGIVPQQNAISLVAIPSAKADPTDAVPDTDLLPHPTGVVDYPTRSTKSRGTSDDLHTQKPPRLAAAVKKIVDVEGPIHRDEAMRVLADAFTARVTPKSREAFDAAVSFAVASRLVTLRGEFLWPPSLNGTVPVRHRGNECPVTRPELIPPEEYTAAVKLVLGKEFGLRADALVDSTLRLMGFQRGGPKLRAAIEESIGALTASGEIATDAAGFLVATDPGARNSSQRHGER